MVTLAFCSRVCGLIRLTLKMIWRILISFICPTLEVAARVPEVIRNYQFYHEIGRLYLWFRPRVFELVAFLLSIEISVIMSHSYFDRHWLVFGARCLAESYITTRIVNEMCDVTFQLSFLHMPYQLLRYMIKLSFIASMAQYQHRPLALIAILYVASWLSILLLEIAVDEFRSFCRWNDPPPKVISATTYWNLVSLLQSSNNGYLSRQFFTVTVSESSRLDDPFWPDHISSVYMVEVRRRNKHWLKFIVWQASMLNGGKKKSHEFNIVDQWTDGQFFGHRCFSRMWTKCFESNGVIFIHDCSWRAAVGGLPLLLLDTRHGKSACYKLPEQDSMLFLSMVSMQCRRRVFGSDGSLQGWRVRFISHSGTQCYCHDFRLRDCLRKTDFDLRQKATLIKEEEIVFGSCENLGRISSRLVRTSRGLFGVYLDRSPEHNGSSILYDVASDRFVHLPNFEALLRSDRPFALYYYTPSPMNYLAVGDNKLGDFCPAVLTSQETVECTKDGKVFRSEFKISSLKYVAAKAVFRAKPNLRSEMTAEDFRRSTGIGGMQSHFDK